MDIPLFGGTVPSVDALAPLPAEYDLDQPWTRQPCDTEHRWRVFLAFRDMAPPRSLLDVCELLAADDGAPFDYSTARLWSGADGWFARCVEYDRWLDAERVRAVSMVLGEDARERALRQVGMLRDLQEVASHVTSKWLQRIRAGVPLHEFTPRDVVRMVKDTIMLERLIHGEITERVGVEVDLSKLSFNELEQLRALEVKAGVVD